MRSLKASVLLLGSSLVFSSGASAGDANKGKLHLQDRTIVDGKPLNPGYYNVEWTGTGPTVQVTLLQGKRTVATFPAHITEQPTQNHDDAYANATEPDGSSKLRAIYIGGKRTALELEQYQPVSGTIQSKAQRMGCTHFFPAELGRNGHLFLRAISGTRKRRLDGNAFSDEVKQLVDRPASDRTRKAAISAVKSRCARLAGVTGKNDVAVLCKGSNRIEVLNNEEYIRDSYKDLWDS